MWINSFLEILVVFFKRYKQKFYSEYTHFMFQLLNLSGRIVALGSTQPLNRNEYKESFLGIKTAGA